MGKKKNQFLYDDADSSDQGDSDQEELYGKKRKHNKQDALYGVFGEDDYEDNNNISFMDDYKKPQKVDFVKKAETDSSNEEDEVASDGDAMSIDVKSDNDEEEPDLRHEITEEELEEEEHFGIGLGGLGSRTGLGLDPAITSSFNNQSTLNVNLTKKTLEKNITKTVQIEATKKVFANPLKTSNQLLTTKITPRPVDKNFASFTKATTGFGLKMMQKMGYKKGEGLGSDGSGIVNPIDVKVRQGKIGVGGMDERTNAIKEEQRIKKEALGLKEEEVKPVLVKHDGWKKSKKKIKKKYVSAADLIKEQEILEGEALPQKIVDMTGKQAREVSHLSELSTSKQVVLNIQTRLPELKHNLLLIVDIASNDLIDHTKAMISEKRNVEDKSTQIKKLDYKLREQNYKKGRVDEVIVMCKEFQQRALNLDIPHSLKENLDDINNNNSELRLEWIIKNFEDLFLKFENHYFQEYLQLKLDEVVFTVLAKFFQNFFHKWNVLSQPTSGQKTFFKLKKLFCYDRYISDKKEAKNEPKLNFYGEEIEEDILPQPELLMTCYENMLYKHWLPKVRSAINNEWNIREPEAIVELLKLWHPKKEFDEDIDADVTSYASKECVLPYWLYLNVLDQLILPKLKMELNNWNPKFDVDLVHTWIHPWLLIFDEETLEKEIFENLRFKLGLYLKDWHPRDKLASEILEPWKDVFSEKVMEGFIFKHILPKLVQCLQTELNLNPTESNLKPLEYFLRFKNLLTNDTIENVFEKEFFPVWHKVLFIWFNQPNFNKKEIGDWYKNWKEIFKENNIENLTQMKIGLKIGLDMISLGTKGMLNSIPKSYNKNEEKKVKVDKLKKTFGRDFGLTFKDLVEKTLNENGLILSPLRKPHPVNGKALFQVSEDGLVSEDNLSITIYFDEGVLFYEDISDKGTRWFPTGIKEIVNMVKR
ncbi:Tuftelin-interacting protein 11 [Lobulomyces angularis]|nr:Tuftelin-interacting protein 11 [Lobulomyces angularis]